MEIRLLVLRRVDKPPIYRVQRVVHVLPYRHVAQYIVEIAGFQHDVGVGKEDFRLPPDRAYQFATHFVAPLD
jgi:hypothetical protein